VRQLPEPVVTGERAPADLFAGSAAASARQLAPDVR